MTRVLVEKDGETVFDEKFENDQVSLKSHRDVTPLYRMGEQEPYTLAPSRFVQDVILCERTCNLNTEVSTMSKESFLKI